MEENRRFHEIDLLKAVAIVMVVGVHAISTSFSDTTWTGRLLGDVTSCAVPGLLFASGFLFDKSGKKSGALMKKLFVRIVPPYIFWSTLMMGFRLPGVNQGDGVLNVKTFFLNLLFGRAVGIYYFVFVIGYLYGISFFFRKLSRRSLMLIWAILAGITLIFMANPLYFIPAPKEWFMFFLMRHPLVHLLPYLSGWLFSLYREEIIPRISGSWAVVGAPILLIDTLLLFTNQSMTQGGMTRLMVQAHIYLAIFLILWLGIHHLKPARPIYYVIRFSYGLFLIHFPFVRAFQGFFPGQTAIFSFTYSPIALASGLGGSLMVIYVVKWLLGRYSVHIIGS